MVLRCQVCGAAHAVCGGSSTVRPVDEMAEPRKEEGMPLKRYKVGDTILKLNDEDARRRGLLGQAEDTEPAPASDEKPQIVSSSRAAPRTTKKA